MSLLRLILGGELEDRLRELLPTADTSDTADTHQKLNLKKGLPAVVRVMVTAQIH